MFWRDKEEPTIIHAPFGSLMKRAPILLLFLSSLMLAMTVLGCNPYSRDGGSSRSSGTSGDDDDAGGSSDDDDDDDGGGPAWVDSDGDGLSDSEEDDLGTNSQDTDSDDDGWDDQEELEGGTDPLDQDDHPYSLGWPIDPCRDDLQPNGDQIGQITSNFELLSQTGEMVRLHDFCGRAVFMITAAFW